MNTKALTQTTSKLTKELVRDISLAGTEVRLRLCQDVPETQINCTTIAPWLHRGYAEVTPRLPQGYPKVVQNREKYVWMYHKKVHLDCTETIPKRYKKQDADAERK